MQSISGYITTGSSIKRNCVIAYHGGNGIGNTMTVNSLCAMYQAPYRIVFIDFT